MRAATIRCRDTTAGDLGRVLAMWLIAVLLAQAQAALATLVRGPAHRHADLVWLDRATQGVQAAHLGHAGQHADDHADDHANGRAHHHSAGDMISLPADGEAALDTAACSLIAVLVPLLALGAALTPLARAAEAPPAAALWAVLTRITSPPRKPPRA
jgi:hypothetical protein